MNSWHPAKTMYGTTESGHVLDSTPASIDDLWGKVPRHEVSDHVVDQVLAMRPAQGRLCWFEPVTWDTHQQELQNQAAAASPLDGPFSSTSTTLFRLHVNPRASGFSDPDAYPGQWWCTGDLFRRIVCAGSDTYGYVYECRTSVTAFAALSTALFAFELLSFLTRPAFLATIW